MVKKIVWTNLAQTQLYECFLNLLEQSQSIEITEKVITEVYNSVEILATNPEIYQLDNLKKRNKGNIRAFHKHNYRVSYQIEAKEIYILRVRPSRKEPLEF